MKNRAAKGFSRHRRRGNILSASGWQGSGTTCGGDPFLSADLAGRRGKIKESEVNGGPRVNHTLILNRVVSHKNTWEGVLFCRGFFWVRSYPAPCTPFCQGQQVPLNRISGIFQPGRYSNPQLLPPRLWKPKGTFSLLWEAHRTAEPTRASPAER